LVKNCYLDPLDHYVLRTLRCGGYLRYVDDMALSSHSRAELENWHAQLTDWLQRRLRLRLQVI